MHDSASSILTAWASFYVIIGSSGAALTGLMFVVITLVAGTPERKTQEGTAVFSTPTVLHFSAALLISALLSAPWRSLTQVGMLLGVIGLCGVGYVARVMHRTNRLSTYRPLPEDWLWYSVLPCVAYISIAIGGFMLPTAQAEPPFALAGAVLLLIFIGIRNAWDVVTYLLLEVGARPQTPK